MAVRGSSSHGDTVSTAMRTLVRYGLRWGGHGVLLTCARVHVFLVARGKALAYALQVWSAMADGEVRRQRESERGEKAHRGWRGRLDGDAVLMRGHAALVWRCSAMPSHVSDEAPVPPSAPTASSSAAASTLSSSPSFPFSLLSLGSDAQRMATKWRRVMVDR